MAKNEAAYAGMVGEFVNALMPFDREELEAGVTAVVLEAKSRRWPALGIVHAACKKAYEDRLEAEEMAEALRRAAEPQAQIEKSKPTKRDRSHLPTFLQNPPVKGITSEQRLCDYYRIQVFRELQKKNALYEVDEHGAYIWTPARVSAEGNARYTENTGRQPPETDERWF